MSNTGYFSSLLEQWEALLFEAHARVQSARTGAERAAAEADFEAVIDLLPAELKEAIFDKLTRLRGEPDL